MHSSQSIAAIAPALVAALAKIQDVKKSESAEVPTKSGGRYTYSYATLADTLQIARPILGEHKLALMQFCRVSDAGSAVEIDTRIMHESGEWVGEVLLMPLPAHATPQEIGSAMSYGRRYGAQPLLGMAAEDDDGKGATDAQRDRGAASRPPAKARTEGAPKDEKAAAPKTAKPTAEQETKALDWVAAIDEAGDAETLLFRYKRGYAEVKAFGFDNLTNLVVAAKNARKKALGITDPPGETGAVPAADAKPAADAPAANESAQEVAA